MSTDILDEFPEEAGLRRANWGRRGTNGIPSRPTGLRTAPTAPDGAKPQGLSAVQQSPDRRISTYARLSNSIQATAGLVQSILSEDAGMELTYPNTWTNLNTRAADVVRVGLVVRNWPRDTETGKR